MNLRVTIGFLVAALVLSVLVDRPRQVQHRADRRRATPTRPRPRPPASSPRSFTFDDSKVNAFELHQADKSVRIEKQGDTLGGRRHQRPGQQVVVHQPDRAHEPAQGDAAVDNPGTDLSQFGLDTPKDSAIARAGRRHQVRARPGRQNARPDRHLRQEMRTRRTSTSSPTSSDRPRTTGRRSEGAAHADTPVPPTPTPAVTPGARGHAHACARNGRDRVRDRVSTVATTLLEKVFSWYRSCSTVGPEVVNDDRLVKCSSRCCEAHMFFSPGLEQLDPALLAFVKCHVTSAVKWEVLRVLASQDGAWVCADQLARRSHLDQPTDAGARRPGRRRRGRNFAVGRSRRRELPSARRRANLGRAAPADRGRHPQPRAARDHRRAPAARAPAGTAAEHYGSRLSAQRRRR